MKKTIKCPVCGKTDIPDYLSEDIKCPCCGSDLSIYRVIEQIPDEDNNKKKKNIWKPISAVAIVAAAALGILLVTNKPETTPVDSGKLAQLRDSITVLNNKLAQKTVSQTSTNVGYSYCVKKGESYWSISKKFYGTGTRAEEIVRNNNRTIGTALLVGDTLIIK